jgi:hypothetical protein
MTFYTPLNYTLRFSLVAKTSLSHQAMVYVPLRL